MPRDEIICFLLMFYTLGMKGGSDHLDPPLVIAIIEKDLVNTNISSLQYLLFNYYYAGFLQVSGQNCFSHVINSHLICMFCSTELRENWTLAFRK